MERFAVSKLIIASKDIDPNRKNELTDECLNYDVKVMSVPEVNTWINGELSFNQIRAVKIEDLLERKQIKLDENAIKKQTLNKTILVTGAAGSIGGEIVKQLTKYRPKKIILFDQAESPLYFLELELQEKLHFDNFNIIIGDITHITKLNAIFKTYKPQIVYHVAAYKHVPMMENHPTEAIRTNVLGTKVLADLSIKHHVQKFVMISTDKAVNPTNIMGASKRLAEIYTQSLNKTSPTNFITTRFGNVLGSQGSVIPRFRKQIEKGGPITLTHPEVTRYFMTIPEAVQLVLEAGAMGHGGEIFIFDMGKSIKIIDLAKKMVRLSGLTIGKDIKLSYTGLRPGEKLYEELLNDKENAITTHHPQIMIAKVQEYDHKTVSGHIDDLINLSEKHENHPVVGLMKRLVPEFISENSIYEELDLKKNQ
ncbi:UDP-N-acetyl-alpha-D-glucosamine C6 dehydratase [subsurface metagenome]